MSRCFPNCELRAAPVEPTIFGISAPPQLVNLAATADGSLTVLGELAVTGEPPRIEIDGAVTAGSATNESTFLVRRHAAGEASARFFSSGTGKLEGADLVADGDRVLFCGNVNGSVTLDGTAVDSGGQQVPLIVAQDSTLTAQQVLTMPTTVNNGQCKAVDVRDGILATTGIMTGTVDPGGGLLSSNADPNAFVAVYDANTFAWRWQHGLVATQPVYAELATFAQDGGIYAGGRFTGSVDFAPPALSSAGGFDGYLIRYSDSGDYVWSASVSGTGDEFIVRSTATDGGFCICGHTTSPTLTMGATSVATSGHDIFVACYDDGGTARWARALQAGTDAVCGAALADGGTVLIAGQVDGGADFGAGPVQAQREGFVAAYDMQGELTGLELLGTGSAVRGLASDSDVLWASGTFAGPLAVDGVTYTPGAAYAGFIAPVRLASP